MCGDVRGRERAILLGLRRVGEGDAIHHFARLYAVLAAVTAVAAAVAVEWVAHKENGCGRSLWCVFRPIRHRLSPHHERFTTNAIAARPFACLHKGEIGKLKSFAFIVQFFRVCCVAVPYKHNTTRMSMSVSVRCFAIHAIKEDLGHVQTQSPYLPIILLQEKLKRFSPFFIFVWLVHVVGKNLMGLNFLTPNESHQRVSWQSNWHLGTLGESLGTLGRVRRLPRCSGPRGE